MFDKNGTEYVENEIASAIARGERTAVITGNREIDRVIRVPSDFTLILDACHLRLADNSFCNVLTNEKSYGEPGTRQTPDRNIRILGRNGAVIDGGNYNGLGEKNAGQDGRPPIYVNNLLLFAGVDGFEVSGICFRNHRWWALDFLYCANGVISDLDFLSNDLRYNEEGELVHGFADGRYHQILVKNADGIDLRKGCHDIEIRNITGFTEDDTVALSLLDGRTEERFDLFGGSRDLYHIKIRNIRSETRCSNVRLLNQGSGKLYGIDIDGVYDQSENSRYLARGEYGVRIGDAHCAYGKGGENGICDVTVRNLRSRARFALHLGGRIEGLVTENIEVFDGCEPVEDLRDAKQQG